LVGLVVGLVVGAFVGCVVGFIVGIEVGIVVGLSVGDGVKICGISMHAFHNGVETVEELQFVVTESK
jgi:hypothetical protein